jgi:hypothetical protein
MLQLPLLGFSTFSIVYQHRNTTQPKFDTTHIDAIERLGSLNQFIKAELNICSITKNLEGLINLINRCFVSEWQKEIPKTLFDFSRTEKKINGINLTWTHGGSESSAHQVFLSGKQIEEFILLMEKKSRQYEL